MPMLEVWKLGPYLYSINLHFIKFDLDDSSVGPELLTLEELYM